MCLCALAVPLLIAGSADIGRFDRSVLIIAGWVIWLAFAVGSLARMAAGARVAWRSPQRRWDLLVVAGHPLVALAGAPMAAPAVAVLRLGGFVASSVRRGSFLQRGWRLLSERPLRALAVIVPLVALLAAAVELRAEAGRSDGSVTSIGDALWWSAATVATVGYGDVSPRSPLGRVVAAATMVVGIGGFSVLTAKLAESLLLQRDRRAGAGVDVVDHSIILGWSPKVPTIVRELMVANESRPEAHIVVLSSRPTWEVQREIDTHVPELAASNTRVVYRSGSPFEQLDIARTRPDRARSVIVVNEDGDPAGVLKAVLVLAVGGAREGIPIVAEVDDAATVAALERTFGDRVRAVDPATLLARITAQSCRQPGLGLCYEELLDFAGAELYLSRVDGAAGHRFGELLDCFEDNIPIALAHADGSLTVCPPMDTVVASDDHLVVFAEDDTTVRYTGPAGHPPSTPSGGAAREPTCPEHVVVLGWSGLGPSLLVELDRRVPPGSRFSIVVDPTMGEVPIGLEGLVSRADVAVHEASGTLHARAVSELCAQSCDHAVILCYRRALSPGEADARALLTMLQARQTLERSGRDHTVVCELLDERDVDLAPIGSVGDFVVSERLASLLMAQLSESPELARVFQAVLDPLGPELYSVPIETYSETGLATAFGSLVAAAREREEIALGYRLARHGEDRSRGFGVVMNAPKSSREVFEPGDRLIVLANPH
jgi:voltage-gated potassium channel Kch